MKEAMVICPQKDNAGHGLQHVRHYAELALAHAFGGCTSISGHGSWVGPDGKLVSEPVWQLVAACEPNASSDAKLESIARYIGKEGKQLAVYVRYPSGDVHIMETAQAIAA